MLKSTTFFFLLLVFALHSDAQTLHLKKRKAQAFGGQAFALNISDSTLSLQEREKIIFKEIRNGNVPDFLRKLVEIKRDIKIKDDTSTYHISYFVLPDYFAIGNNADYLYIPMTPILAQRVANLTESILPTRALVNEIYSQATIKLRPQPILPTKAMTTLPIFIAHNDSVKNQLRPLEMDHLRGKLTAGNKKDVIISNKIYGETTPRVVIYGWHKLDGKNIQPMYNKHTNTWADYSHGIRLIQNKIYINGTKEKLSKILVDPILSALFSDEGAILSPFYPIPKTY